jgi:hypothetical protein
VFGIPPRVIFRHCIFSDPQISSGSVGFGIAFSVIFRHWVFSEPRVLGFVIVTGDVQKPVGLTFPNAVMLDERQEP